MVIVKNRTLLFLNKEQYIGTPYDNYSTVRTFSMDRVTGDGIDIAHLQFYINIGRLDKTEDTDELIKEVTEEKIILKWTISEKILKETGTAFIGIRAHDLAGVLKWATYPAPVYIGDVMKLPEIKENDLSVLEKLEAEVATIKETEEVRNAAEAEREKAETAREEAEDQRKENASKLEMKMESATTAAKEAVKETEAATEAAKTAAKAAGDAADRVDTAVESAEQATKNANSAAESVENAKERAEQAAASAESAAGAATEAAGSANTKAQLADTAAGNADEAARKANEAAERASSAASQTVDDTLTKSGVAADAAKTGEEIRRIDGAIEDTNSILSDAYSNTSTYTVGDYCIYDQAMYKCREEISEPEEFAPVHWEKVRIAEEMNGLTNRVTPIEKGGTGAADARTAYMNLSHVYVNTTGTSMDDYEEPGVYYFNSNYTPDNIPRGCVNGWLIVLHDTGKTTKQIFLRRGTADKNDHDTWSRIGDDSGWSNWTQYISAADGGAFTSNFAIKRGYDHYSSVCDFEQSTELRSNATDETGYTALIMYNKNYPKGAYPAYRVKESGSESNYKLYGEHNKPTGSYTGNGTSTSRTIDVGGIGQPLLIISPKGYFALVTSNGCITGLSTSTTVSAIPSAECKFDGGILTIASTKANINANGATYYYRLL